MNDRPLILITNDDGVEAKENIKMKSKNHFSKENLNG